MILRKRETLSYKDIITVNKVITILECIVSYYRWVVMRGLTIDPSTATEINIMDIKGARQEGA